MAFVAIAAVLFMPLGLAPAHADPDYPPSFYKITAERYTATIGQRIQFTAQTFRSGSTVTVDVTESGAPSADSATVTANRKGIAKASVTFTVEGINTVTMSGTADDGRPLALAADITVTAENVEPVNGNGGSGDNARRERLRRWHPDPRGRPAAHRWRDRRHRAGGGCPDRSRCTAGGLHPSPPHQLTPR